jgi:glycine hydroxymethyltransferase
MKEAEMKQIGQMIAKVLKDIESEKIKQTVSAEIKELCKRFPLYE